MIEQIIDMGSINTIIEKKTNTEYKLKKKKILLMIKKNTLVELKLSAILIYN